MIAVLPRRRERILPVAADGWLVCSDEQPARPLASVVVCHDLLADRDDGLLEVLAERLADHGFAARRFDFRGAGDSSGSFPETSFAAMCTDLTAAVADERRRRPELPLALVGVGIGGVAPALCARTIPAVAAVALVASDLLEHVVFAVDDAVVPIRGGAHVLPERFFRERETLEPLSDLVAAGVRARVFHGADDAKVIAAYPRFAAAGLAVEAVGEDASFATPAAREQLADRLAKWLAEAVGVA